MSPVADPGPQATDDVAYIVYDGDCPFCSRYVNLLRLRDAVGPVELVDARAPHPVVDLLRQRHIDLDEGMALVRGGTVSHGDDCIHQIALLTTPSGLFNRLNGWLFRSPTAARLLYPVLRFCRNATLALLGRRKLGPL